MLISFHPLADIFPLIEGAEFDALVADVREQGLREPIVLFEGSILDGRNRYRACNAAGVEPRFETYDGTDPVGYVISLNIHRRHLNESQRAMAHARIATLKHGVRSDTAIAVSVPTQAQASAMLNVSVDSGQRARKVLNEGTPELIKAVESGDVSVSAGAHLATLPREDQTAIVEAGPTVAREAAKTIREGGVVNRTSFTGNNQWFTPAPYLTMAREVLGEIDLDPATHEIAQQSVKASKFYTEEDNSLTKEWHGRIWLNPPYAQPEIGHFADKMVEESSSGRVEQAIMLTHNYTDTAWFQKLARAASSICFTRGRIRFISPTGEIAAPTQGQAFFYFGANIDSFKKVFSEIGFVK